MKKRAGIWFLVTLGILSVPLVARLQRPQSPLQTQAAPIPRFVTYHLAEVHLTSNHKWPKGNDYSGLHDLKKNYSIKDGDGPDGCEYILTLRLGSGWDIDSEELRERFQGVRLKLVTGRGVTIGDTPQEVERKIGKPTVTDMKGAKGIRDNQPYEILPSYTYTYKGKRFYEARYSFRNGKLAEIIFRDARPPSKDTGPDGGCP